jgi:hypothetical protein
MESSVVEHDQAASHARRCATGASGTVDARAKPAIVWCEQRGRQAGGERDEGCNDEGCNDEGCNEEQIRERIEDRIEDRFEERVVFANFGIGCTRRSRDEEEESEAIQQF